MGNLEAGVQPSPIQIINEMLSFYKKKSFRKLEMLLEKQLGTLGDTSRIMLPGSKNLLLSALLEQPYFDFTTLLLSGVEDWGARLPWPGFKECKAFPVNVAIMMRGARDPLLDEWTVQSLLDASRYSNTYGYGLAAEDGAIPFSIIEELGADLIAANFSEHYRRFSEYLKHNPPVVDRLRRQHINLSFWERPLSPALFIVEPLKALHSLSAGSIKEVEKKEEAKPLSAPVVQAADVESMQDYMGTKIIQADLKRKIISFQARNKFDSVAEVLGADTRAGARHHMIFVGGPGTGKTLFSNVLGRYLKEQSIVTKGHVVHTTAALLIGEYVGQTAPRVRKAVEDAIGGVLFIDEVYNFANEERFGPDAITELLAQMENRRGEFVLVVAGYPDEVQSFLDLNPGLPDRFGHKFPFSHFKKEELAQILNLNLRRKKMSIEPLAQEAIITKLEQEKRDNPRSFSNARRVEGVLEKAITAHAVAANDGAYFGKTGVSTSSKERTWYLKVTLADVRSVFKDEDQVDSLRLDRQVAIGFEPS